MSVVTNVILVTCHEADKAKELYSRFSEVDDKAGGNKCMECSIVMAGINYLDRDSFIEAFRKTKWEYPECAQLMLMGQDDDIFETFTIN